MKTVELKNVSKIYKKGPTSVPTTRDWADWLFGRQVRLRPNNFYALRDLSFSLNQGGVTGFIGKNGAGKSTILKIISKVTYPTSGNVKTVGRVAGLLELGAGFHPELTGKENIFFNAAILGMGQKEVKKKLGSIIEFSELGEFIDTPVKYYSSGMYARLGFSVAIQAEPDILLIDEVLSVGDASFQKKCVEKIENYCRDKKRTVIFVSHNLDYVKKICRRLFWLEKGRIVMEGPPSKVISAYLKSSQR